MLISESCKHPLFAKRRNARYYQIASQVRKFSHKEFLHQRAPQGKSEAPEIFQFFNGKSYCFSLRSDTTYSHDMS